MSQATNNVPITVYATYGTSQQSSNQSRWRNQPQSNSVAAGGIIFISAGLNLAQGLGWNQGTGVGYTDHFKYSWFIGVIIGTILAAPIANLFPKKLMMGITTLLILIEGIIFTSAPNEYNALLAGRYLNGIAVGFATLLFIIHASEIAVDTYRGSCLAVEQYGICFGIALQVIYASQWGLTDFPANRLHGIFDIIFSLFAMISLIGFIESPIYHIRKGDENAALDCLSRLQRPTGMTATTTLQLQERKNYVIEQENYTPVESIKHGLIPLVKIILFRSLIVAFSFSLPLSIALQYSLVINLITWPPIVAGCLRIFGALLSVSLVDVLTRKLPSLIWILSLGVLTVATGAMFDNISNVLNTHNMSVATSLLLLIQFFAGLFVPFTSVYMGEAFPLIVKPYFLAISIIVEQLIHIIVICTFTTYASSIYNSLLAQGIIILTVAIIFAITMPETRKTSLREAQNRFRQFIYLKMY